MPIAPRCWAKALHFGAKPLGEPLIMANVNSIIDRLVEVFVGLCLGGMVLISSIQVTSRYLFGYSFGWAEDLSIILFCWTVWPTACLVLKQKKHLQVTVIMDKINWRQRRLITIILQILTLIFLGVIIYGGLEAMEAMEGFHYITMPLPQNVKYSSVPLGAALMLYYLARVIWLDLKDGQDGNL